MALRKQYEATPMKTVKTLLLCLACLLVFVVTAATSCAIRAKYWELPKLRAGFAHSYAAFLGEYSFLQYKQAGGEQAKTALLAYLGELRRIQREKIRYPENSLHFDSALTYLRLYRLEVAANNPSKADEYLRSAQKELTSLGWKDVSAEHLIRVIAAREIDEARLYNNAKDMTAPAAGQKP